MEWYGKQLTLREKGLRADIVTEADGAAEELIVRRLRAAYPAAAILGEESGLHSGTNAERWIVDPLDGTTNFAHGYPFFCVSIAYELQGELHAGAIYAPFFDELFIAEKGKGAFLNGQRIQVSQTPNIASGLVCTGFVPSRYEQNAAHFARLSHHAQGVRRDGSAALDLASVAAGALIVTEAGGHVTNINTPTFDVNQRSILASNAKVHQEMQTLLSIPT